METSDWKAVMKESSSSSIWCSTDVFFGFVKIFEPFSFASKSSIVGVGYRVLVIALFAPDISTQILMLCWPLGTITNGFNHEVGSPVTSLMIPSFSNLIFLVHLIT